MSIDKLIIEKYFENHTDLAVKKLSLLTENEILSIIKNLTKENVYKVFCRFERYRAIKIFNLLEPKNIADIFNNIPSNIAVSFMRQMNKDKLNFILTELSDNIAVQLTKMLQYDEFTVGAYMTTNIFTLTDDISIHDALEDIKRYNGIIPAQIFIVDRDQKLKGKIDLHQLIRCNTKDDLRTIMNNIVPKILPQITIKSISDHEGWRDYYMLPVADGNDFFLGVITLEAIREIVQRKSKKELKQFAKVGSALGELYRLGISGLIRSATEISTNQKNDNL